MQHKKYKKDEELEAQPNCMNCFKHLKQQSRKQTQANHTITRL